MPPSKSSIEVNAQKIRRNAVGSIHGRFQVFHLEHLEYFRAASRLFDVVYIGLARPSLSAGIPSSDSSHRDLLASNPLTYFERTQMIEGILLAEGYSSHSFRIIPFPIDEPHLLNEFLPRNVPIATTVNDSWNEQKIRVLESIGYKVEILWTAEKKISASVIRAMIENGDSSWRLMVPDSCAKFVEIFKLQERLRALNQQSAP